jgi:hypothetical protein
MRKQVSVLAGLAFVALVAVACEGPQGPQGPEGPQGAQGDVGPQGPAGVDANANCTDCHVGDTELFAREVQYEASVHRNGGNFERGGSASCAACHTSEGFVERIAAGTEAPDSGFPNPSPVNCRTCHMIHTTYTRADYELRTTDPVDLFASDDQVDFGEGNLCASCHQARAVSPKPVIDGADVTIASTRYDMHHGPQGNILGGVSLFEFAGSMTITGGPNTHGDVARNEKGCITCHMATAYGSQAGGHTWNMTYSSHGSVEDNIAGCLTCHSSSLEDFDYHGVQADVEVMMDSLEVLLTNIGIYNTSTGLANLGTYPANVVAAYLNFLTIEEDRSEGVHNPEYVTAVLNNTIEVVTPLAPAPAVTK